ncbi:MAG: DinB family protein [Candidatus Dormibacteria bacterium]
MPRQLLTTADILTILGATTERIRQWVGGAAEAELHGHPAPGEWSATEILAHLRSCSDVWGGVIECILDQDHPTIRAVNPVTWIERTDYRELKFHASLQAFSEQRTRHVRRIGSLSPRSWSRSATVLGGGKPLELTAHAYGARWARHERVHWKQIQAALQRSSPGAKGTGS